MTAAAQPNGRAARQLAAAAMLLGATATAGRAADGPRQHPEPVPVVSGVTRAFAQHRIVAITDPRTSALNRVIVSLMRDPTFRARTRLIVYDCCALRYQALVDRYVRGDAVSLAAVSQAWASAGPALPNPNLFVAARRLNRNLPRSKRLRILLAHPWASGTFVCRRGRPCNPWGNRLDRVIFEVVERRVLFRHQNALLLASYWKLDRRRRPTNASGFGTDSAARLIERRHPGSLFLVWANSTCTVRGSHAPDVIRSWPRPALATIAGTSVGAAPETLLWNCVPRTRLRGLLLAPPRAERHVEEDTDAILTVAP